jgi:hypothetical protein
MSTPELIYRDAGNYFVLWEDRVVIQIRTGELSAAAFDAIEPAVRLARARMKSPYGAFGVLEAGAATPAPEVRKRQRALFESMLDPRHTFGALVVLGDGAQAVARRAVFRTLLLFRRREMRVFDAVPSAASWLAERIGVDATALEHAVASAREATSRLP